MGANEIEPRLTHSAARAAFSLLALDIYLGFYPGKLRPEEVRGQVTNLNKDKTNERKTKLLSSAL